MVLAVLVRTDAREPSAPNVNGRKLGTERHDRSRGGVTHSSRHDRLVLDDVETLLAELCEVVQHAFQYLGGVALPALNLGDDVQRVARPVGLRGVAGNRLLVTFGSSSNGPMGSTTYVCPRSPFPASEVANSASWAELSGP